MRPFAVFLLALDILLGLNLYEISSGGLVISARVPFGEPGSFDFSMLFSHALWVEDRYFTSG